MREENQTKTCVWKDLSLCLETSIKKADQEFQDFYNFILLFLWILSSWLLHLIYVIVDICLRKFANTSPVSSPLPVSRTPATNRHLNILDRPIFLNSMEATGYCSIVITVFSQQVMASWWWWLEQAKKNYSENEAKICRRWPVTGGQLVTGKQQHRQKICQR